jgi:hypothetical protein
VKLLGNRQLCVLLIGTLLLCHGALGALHLACNLPECAGERKHAADHQHADGAAGDAHEHSAGHATNTEYFAVVTLGLLVLLLRLMPKVAPLRIQLGARWPAVLRRVPAISHPPPTPTPLILQVFRL